MFFPTGRKIGVESWPVGTKSNIYIYRRFPEIYFHMNVSVQCVTMILSYNSLCELITIIFSYINANAICDQITRLIIMGTTSKNIS